MQAAVRDASQIEAMFNTITEQFGNVDVLESDANMNFTAKLFLEQSWVAFS